MKANKKQLIFLVIVMVLVIGLITGAVIIATSLTNKTLTGSTFNIGETSSLPASVKELTCDEIKPLDASKKAAVTYTYKENEEIKEFYQEYDTVKEAYDFCNLRDYLQGINNRNINITLIFFDDWIAEGEEGFGEAETVGYGKGGAISPYYRESTFTINLNGHTLGRKLENTIDNGSVIIVDDSYNLEIYNGYITGGKTTGNGGGILVYYVGWDTNVYLSNVHITGNEADGLGGGIFTSYKVFSSSSYYVHETNLYLNNTSIYYNIAKTSGGGMYSDIYTGACDMVKVYLECRVVIDYNKCTSDSKHHNYTLGRTDRTTFTIYSTQSLTSGSCICISFSNNTSEESRFSEVSTDKTTMNSVKSFFHTDDGDRKIVLSEYDSKYELCTADDSGC